MNISKLVRDAGVIGMGGAGFPTYIKLAADFKHIIVNAVECEPLLRTDRYVVLHHADEIVETLRVLMANTSATMCTIALKKTYTNEIKALRQALREPQITLALVDTYYPAGDEQSLVYDVLGKTVPPLNIPLSLEAVVLNVSTVLACADALIKKPLTHRYITVAGAVAKPCVLHAPLGVSFADCLQAAGGITGKEGDMCIVSGGPMMGRRYPDYNPETLFVDKTTAAILVLPKASFAAEPLQLERIRQTAKAACIQCNYCTELCPRYLLGHPLEPHKIMRTLAHNELKNVMDHPAIRAAALCCECGICEIYACPMQLKPRDVNVLIKKEMQKAGIRMEKFDSAPAVHPMRESRKVATKRAAARAGVAEYYDWEFGSHRIVTPSRISLSLKQGIGVAAMPCVRVGDVVAVGDLLAECPEQQMGSHVHAPIAGRVESVGDHIVIVR